MRTSLHNRAVVNQRKPWMAKIEKKKKKKNFEELIGWWAGGVRAGSYTDMISFWNPQNSLQTWSNFKSMR